MLRPLVARVIAQVMSGIDESGSTSPRIPVTAVVLDDLTQHIVFT